MTSNSKKAVNYRLDKSVVDMLNTIAIEEDRSLNNTIEMLIKEYYKKTRRNGEMKNLLKEEIIKLAMDEYNKMATALDFDLSTEKDFKVIEEKLNIEFEGRAYHIDNGQYALKSGIESKHWINYKDGTQYLIKNINFANRDKTFENKITIDYLC